MKDLRKRYRLGLDVMGLGLFVLIMLPNVIWMAVPPVPDPLSLPSVTPRLDLAASAAQALMVAALCLVKSRQTVPVPRPAAAAIGLCCLGYYAAWGCYYGGVLHPALFLSMCVLPCLALLLYAAARRNWAAFVPGVVFSVLHGVYGICNFLL